MGAKTALIFGSMDAGDWCFLAPLHEENPTVFCADGGLFCAIRAGFSPQYYIGDGDSGGKPMEGVCATVLPTQKDLTDLQAAWEQAYAMGFRKIYLTGCTGGRQDHHIAALQLLETMAKRSCEGYLLDAENEISFLLPGLHKITPAGFQYFSLLPVDAQVTVSISGAKYDLDKRLLQRGDSLCVSNEPLAQRIVLTLSGGSCYLIFSQKNTSLSNGDLS